MTRCLPVWIYGYSLLLGVGNSERPQLGSFALRNLTALIMVYGLAAWTTAGAEQVCPQDIPQTTPTADFINHGDGTVTHVSTGLMWKKCHEGLSGENCSTGSATKHTWQQALQLANGHSFAGYTDWRLPNIKELSSIVERGCYSPAVNLAVFPNDAVSYVWSSGPLAVLAYGAWDVHFANGYANARNQYNENQVRLVRGGQ